MVFTETPLEGAFLIDLEKRGDDRGIFARAFCEKEFGAHGLVTITDDCEAFYLVDQFYRPELERGVRWNEPRFKIRWPIEPVVISDKDKAHRDFDPAWHLGGPA